MRMRISPLQKALSAKICVLFSCVLFSLYQLQAVFFSASTASCVLFSLHQLQAVFFSASINCKLCSFQPPSTASCVLFSLHQLQAVFFSASINCKLCSFQPLSSTASCVLFNLCSFVYVNYKDSLFTYCNLFSTGVIS